jgi:hypothetical protein
MIKKIRVPSNRAVVGRKMLQASLLMALFGAAAGGFRIRRVGALVHPMDL